LFASDLSIMPHNRLFAPKLYGQSWKTFLSRLSLGGNLHAARLEH
jgi:hypothetical protein